MSDPLEGMRAVCLCLPQSLMTSCPENCPLVPSQGWRACPCPWCWKAFSRRRRWAAAAAPQILRISGYFRCLQVRCQQWSLHLPGEASELKTEGADPEGSQTNRLWLLRLISERPLRLSRALLLFYFFFLDFSERRTLESWSIRVTHLSVEISDLKITTSRLGGGGTGSSGWIIFICSISKNICVDAGKGSLLFWISWD